MDGKVKQVAFSEAEDNGDRLLPKSNLKRRSAIMNNNNRRPKNASGATTAKDPNEAADYLS